MKDDEPHRIEDNAPNGEQTISSVKTKRKKKKVFGIMVEIGFDENMKEFQLWDFLYDVETDHFELDAIPDYENRIQYYEIKANRVAIGKLREWLIENNFKYKFKFDKR